MGIERMTSVTDNVVMYKTRRVEREKREKRKAEGEEEKEGGGEKRGGGKEGGEKGGGEKGGGEGRRELEINTAELMSKHLQTSNDSGELEVIENSRLESRSQCLVGDITASDRIVDEFAKILKPQISTSQHPMTQRLTAGGRTSEEGENPLSLIENTVSGAKEGINADMLSTINNFIARSINDSSTISLPQREHDVTNYRFDDVTIQRLDVTTSPSAMTASKVVTAHSTECATTTDLTSSCADLIDQSTTSLLHEASPSRTLPSALPSPPPTPLPSSPASRGTHGSVGFHARRRQSVFDSLSSRLRGNTGGGGEAGWGVARRKSLFPGLGGGASFNLRSVDDRQRGVLHRGPHQPDSTISPRSDTEREDAAPHQPTYHPPPPPPMHVRRRRRKEIEERFGRRSRVTGGAGGREAEAGEDLTLDFMEDELKGPRCWAADGVHVFDPAGGFSYWWSFVVSVAFLYNFWVIVYRFAFHEITASTAHIWLTLDYLADLIFVLDIVVHCRTGYLDDGVLQTSGTKLRQHYFHSSRFCIDCVCLLPLDFLYLAVGYKSLLRCLRLLKVYRYWSFLDRTERHTNYPNVVRTVTLLHYLFAFYHWNACLIYTTTTHLDSLTWGYPNEQQDVIVTYLHSLYLSTLALTRSRVVAKPKSKGEFAIVILQIVIALLLFATVLGHVSNIVTSISAARKDFQAKLDSVKTYMSLRRVPQRLEDRVIKWFDYLWLTKKSSDELKTLQLLPDKLKAEIALHVHLDTLKRVEIFQNTEAGFLCELVLRLRPVLFSPGDYICRRGEVGKEMYIVNRGRLEVVTDNGRTVLATMRPGSYFGEISILNMGGAGNRRTASVRSLGYSDLFCLSKNDLWEVLKDYPTACGRLEAIAVKRLQNYHDKSPVNDVNTVQCRGKKSNLSSSVDRPINTANKYFKPAVEINHPCISILSKPLPHSFGALAWKSNREEADDHVSPHTAAAESKNCQAAIPPTSSANRAPLLSRHDSLLFLTGDYGTIHDVTMTSRHVDVMQASAAVTGGSMTAESGSVGDEEKWEGLTEREREGKRGRRRGGGEGGVRAVLAQCGEGSGCANENWQTRPRYDVLQRQCDLAQQLLPRQQQQQQQQEQQLSEKQLQEQSERQQQLLQQPQRLLQQPQQLQQQSQQLLRQSQVQTRRWSDFSGAANSANETGGRGSGGKTVGGGGSVGGGVCDENQPGAWIASEDHVGDTCDSALLNENYRNDVTMSDTCFQRMGMDSRASRDVIPPMSVEDRQSRDIALAYGNILKGQQYLPSPFSRLPTNHPDRRHSFSFPPNLVDLDVFPPAISATAFQQSRANPTARFQQLCASSTSAFQHSSANLTSGFQQMRPRFPSSGTGGFRQVCSTICYQPASSNAAHQQTAGFSPLFQQASSLFHRTTATSQPDHSPSSQPVLSDYSARPVTAFYAITPSCLPPCHPYVYFQNPHAYAAPPDVFVSAATGPGNPDRGNYSLNPFNHVNSGNVQHREYKAEDQALTNDNDSLGMLQLADDNCADYCPRVAAAAPGSVDVPELERFTELGPFNNLVISASGSEEVRARKVPRGCRTGGVGQSRSLLDVTSLWPAETKSAQQLCRLEGEADVMIHTNDMTRYPVVVQNRGRLGAGNCFRPRGLSCSPDVSVVSGVRNSTVDGNVRVRTYSSGSDCSATSECDSSCLLDDGTLRREAEESMI